MRHGELLSFRAHLISRDKEEQMIRIVNIAQMRAVETEADTKGTSFSDLMDKAGAAVANQAEQMVPIQHGKKIIALCGPGNNGGDGLVAAGLLAKLGAHVLAFLPKGRSLDEERVKQAIANGAIVQSLSASKAGASLKDALADASLLLDSLLGTGAKLPLRKDISDILDLVQTEIRERNKHLKILAVDCPSGVDCDSGDMAPNILPADCTITFGAVKNGLTRFPAADFVGTLIVADIGLSDELEAWKGNTDYWVTKKWALSLLPLRSRNSHKGTYGRVIIAGGSINLPGAPILAANGALRSGTGLVTIAATRAIHGTMAAAVPEVTWILLPEETGVVASGAETILLPEMRQTQALVLGPGMGREKTTQIFLKNLLYMSPSQKTSIGFTHAPAERETPVADHRPPMVIDADGLRLLTGLENWWTHLPTGSILTPHPGEMAELTGLPKEKIQEDRIGIARKFAKDWGVVIVLKGAFTVVAHPDGRIAVEPFATSALAHAGTGDVLAGVIGGLLAQRMSAWEAAVLGAFLHGRAGELAADVSGDEAGVQAGEIAAMLPKSIRELRGCALASAQQFTER